MKMFLIILMIYLFALKTNPSEKIVLINDNNKSNIIVTSDLLSCKSVLGDKGNMWTHWNKTELKQGINEFGFVPFDGMRVEIEITKY